MNVTVMRMCYVHEGIIMMEGREVLGSCRCSFK